VQAARLLNLAASGVIRWAKRFSAGGALVSPCAATPKTGSSKDC